MIKHSIVLNPATSSRPATARLGDAQKLPLHVEFIGAIL